MATILARRPCMRPVIGWVCCIPLRAIAVRAMEILSTILRWRVLAPRGVPSVRQKGRVRHRRRRRRHRLLLLRPSLILPSLPAVMTVPKQQRRRDKRSEMMRTTMMIRSIITWITATTHGKLIPISVPSSFYPFDL